MGKKSKNNENRPSSNRSGGGKNSRKSPNYFVILIVVAIVGSLGYVAANSGKDIDPKYLAAYNEKIKGLNLKETNPVLPPSFWGGRTGHAYELAGEIPQVLDQVYCYCDCSKNPRLNHKSLLTCFTDDHGSKCDICQNEVFSSYKLFKKGLSIAEVAREIDNKFSRIRDNHRG